MFAKSLKQLFAGFVFLLGTLAASRADVVVPNIYNSVDAPGAFTLFAPSITRTYQFIINQNQLTSVINHNILGFQLRANALGQSLTTTLTTTDFQVRVGPGVAPAAASTTFAANFSGTPVLLRSGALTMPVGSSGPNPSFGTFVIAFNSPYLYTGGHLTMELRYDGAPNFFFDAATSASPGWGVDYTNRFASSKTATTGGGPLNHLVVNFVTQPIPEPSSFLWIALSGAMLALSRRRI